jgi:hypothetical protein
VLWLDKTTGAFFEIYRRNVVKMMALSFYVLGRRGANTRKTAIHKNTINESKHKIRFL